MLRTSVAVDGLCIIFYQFLLKVLYINTMTLTLNHLLNPVNQSLADSAIS